MAVDQLEAEQQRALPEVDLSVYGGQWVALRDGSVIASDLDAVALRNNPEVRQDDILTPVPSQEDGVFIL